MEKRTGRDTPTAAAGPQNRKDAAQTLNPMWVSAPKILLSLKLITLEPPKPLRRTRVPGRMLVGGLDTGPGGRLR